MAAVRRAPIALVPLAAIVALYLIGWPASIYRHGAADMPQFWLAARTLLEGRMPYEIWDWPYPLWTAVALLPLGLIPLDVAAPLWLVGQLVAVAVALELLARRVLVTDRRRDRVVLFGMALAMQPTWLLVGGGNMTGLLFGAFAGALVARISGRAGLAGALLGLLVTKPMAFVVSGPSFLIATRGPARWRVLAGAVAVAATLVIASFALRPDWVGLWTGNAVALQTSGGSNATGWTLGRASAPAIPPWLVSTLATTALVAAFALWWWRRRPPFPLLIAGAVPVSLFAAPHGWSYDQLHLLITYAVALERIARAGSRRVAWLVALLAVACVVPWALYASAFTTGGEERTAVVPVLAFALLVAADARAIGAARSATTP
jgi:hypothetical protein